MNFHEKMKTFSQLFALIHIIANWVPAVPELQQQTVWMREILKTSKLLHFQSQTIFN